MTRSTQANSLDLFNVWFFNCFCASLLHRSWGRSLVSESHRGTLPQASPTLANVMICLMSEKICQPSWTLIGWCCVTIMSDHNGHSSESLVATVMLGLKGTQTQTGLFCQWLNLKVKPGVLTFMDLAVHSVTVGHQHECRCCKLGMMHCLFDILSGLLALLGHQVASETPSGRRLRVSVSAWQIWCRLCIAAWELSDSELILCWFGTQWLASECDNHACTTCNQYDVEISLPAQIGVSATVAEFQVYDAWQWISALFLKILCYKYGSRVH